MNSARQISLAQQDVHRVHIFGVSIQSEHLIHTTLVLKLISLLCVTSPLHHFTQPVFFYRATIELLLLLAYCIYSSDLYMIVNLMRPHHMITQTIQ